MALTTGSSTNGAHDVHQGTSVDDFKQAFLENLFAAVGRRRSTISIWRSR
jgi:hypothetical protein